MSPQIKDTTKYGKSIFTTHPYKKGEVVLTVCGPIVKKASRYTIPIDYGLYIDPVPTDNPARYLSHSCAPSCGVKNRTQVVAMQEIPAGAEITIDYAMIVPKYGPELPEEQRKCLCGTEECRGQLGSFDTLPPATKEKYTGYISDYLIE